MAVSIVVGGQYGSEGKGKVAFYFAQKLNAAAIVRVGGVNSGHTVITEDGKQYIFRSLPTSSVDPSKISILPSGAYIALDILFQEIHLTNIQADRLAIDPYAVVIDEKMVQAERDAELWQKIGSTQSGTGAAVIARLMRQTDGITFAKDAPQLKPYVRETKPLLRRLLDSGAHVVIEGTQGFGLSPLNSSLYPYCTSRDTTAGSFLAEAGLSPLDVENVIMVLRAYPIRVAGESGPLPEELDWEKVSAASGSNQDLTEYTSCTKRVRRVAAFHPEIVKQAIQVNRPNIIVMNHLDYIDYACRDSDYISDAVMEFVDRVSAELGQSIDYLGTGKAHIIKAERRSQRCLSRKQIIKESLTVQRTNCCAEIRQKSTNGTEQKIRSHR